MLGIFIYIFGKVYFNLIANVRVRMRTRTLTCVVRVCMQVLVYVRMCMWDV